MVGKSRLSRRGAMAGTWAGRACAMAAAGLAVAMIAGGGAATETPMVEPVVASGPQLGQPEPQTTSALDDIGLIVANLEPWDGPAPKRDPGLIPPKPMSEGPGLAYLGVIRLGDRVRALISADGKQRFVKAGDQVGSATIVSIEEKYVILDEDGRRRRVGRRSPSAERLGYLGSTGPPIRIEDGRGTSVLDGGGDDSLARRRELREQMRRTRQQGMGDAASVINPAAAAKRGRSLPGAQLPVIAPGGPDVPATLISPDGAALRGGAPSTSSDEAEGS